MYGSLKNQRGFLLYLAVILVTVVGFLGITITRMYTASTFSQVNYSLATKAIYLSEAAIERAAHQLLTFDPTDRSTCSGLSLTGNLGSGTYTVTGTGPQMPATTTALSAALTAVATTIPVVSTANYDANGRIMIDAEYIDYASVDATNFIGVIRGVDGTTAAAHANGTLVGQYECDIIASGGVPNLNAPANPGNPTGRRVVNATVQLQEGWAVGDGVSNNATLIHWNYPTEKVWNNASFPAGANLPIYGVFMLSHADGWVVGGSEFFGRFTGGAAVSFVDSGLPAANYRSIYCSASNDCQVVGDHTGNQTTGDPIIARWNGTTWTRLIPTGASVGTDLDSVHCNASNNCWAVGDNAGNASRERFYQWTGGPNWAAVDVTALTSGFPFNGVYCTTGTDCWAVGVNNVFARRAGASWASVTVATIPSTQYNGIYCNASNDCWVVGNYNGGRDLIVHWDGSAWSRNVTAPTTPAANLNSVSCVHANDCWATGATTAGNNPNFVHWDGSTWSQFTTAGLPAGAPLRGISVIGPNKLPIAEWNENFG